MRILVTGSRDWYDDTTIAAMLNGFLAISDDVFDEEFVVIEGGARGADECAREWRINDVRVRHITEHAEWTRYGKPAGPIRNRKMLDEHEPDLVLAFHDDLENSKGTKDMVEYASEKDVPVFHIRCVAR